MTYRGRHQPCCSGDLKTLNNMFAAKNEKVDDDNIKVQTILGHETELMTSNDNYQCVG